MAARSPLPLILSSRVLGILKNSQYLKKELRAAESDTNQLFQKNSAQNWLQIYDFYAALHHSKQLNDVNSSLKQFCEPAFIFLFIQ